jgi:ribosomal protein S18 acetylase RimI-like enzyme
MKFEIVPAHELSLAEQATVFTEAFSGYVAGSVQLNAGALATFIAGQGIDICHSRYARSDTGHLVSFGYINRTGNISRLAGMGTVSGARRSGAAAFVLNSLMEEAKQRGDEAMVLEVIEQNPAAVQLYETQGFRRLTTLYGWRSGGAIASPDAKELRAVPMFEALQLSNRPDYPAIPWQISAHAAAKVVSAHTFELDDTAVVTSDPAAPPIRLHAFLGTDGTNWKSLRELIQALLGNWPEREIYAPPIFPEQFANEVFQPLNFRREELRQFLMRKDL